MRRRTGTVKQPVNLAAPLFIVVVLIGVWGWMGNDVMMGSESPDGSESRGTRIKGFMKNGKRLPVRGPNFESYSRLLSSFGRTCVNGQVRDAVLDAYATVHEKEPKYTFVFGETGWCGGGSFWPHHSHQNGLSVDFMVPVTRSERVEATPSTILDGFGYANEFDADGKMGEYVIDFDAIALHLQALREAAKKHGLEIERVILDAELQDEMFKAKKGRRLKKQLKWVGKAWTRHDDHYHVDFIVKKEIKPTRPKKGDKKATKSKK